MNPDQLAELEEERTFLLRSLVDLEREHAVGDVDDVDYHELKEGYTVRAAATLRAIDDGRSALPAKPTPNWKRRGVIAGGIVVAVLLVWWALATWSAERKPGQEISGFDPRSQQQQLMAQARAIQFQSPGDASELYAQVLQTEPDNVEALTYRGWTLALDAVQSGGSDSGADDKVVTELREAVDSLRQAIDLDPTYPDPKCFLGIVNLRILRQPEAAQPWVDACLAANPPADIRELVQGMNDEIAAELDQQPTSAAPTTTAP
jgi:cytochrome c-type biogenesis protein CcmH/NrfG